MRKNPTSRSGVSHLRVILAFALCSVGVLLAASSFTPPVEHSHGATSAGATDTGKLQRDMPVPGGEPDDLNRLEVEWNNRLTYPTGLFDPAWVRLAAATDALISRAVPAGLQSTKLNSSESPLALSATSFTALGPQPEHMTGCTGCYNYVTTEGRVNSIAVDP